MPRFHPLCRFHPPQHSVQSHRPGSLSPAPPPGPAAVLHTLLALWTQYLSLAVLLLYALLRVVLAGSIPLGQYSGPLSLLWPLSFLLLLTSYCSDLLLWREEWAAAPKK